MVKNELRMCISPTGLALNKLMLGVFLFYFSHSWPVCRISQKCQIARIFVKTQVCVLVAGFACEVLCVRIAIEAKQRDPASNLLESLTWWQPFCSAPNFYTLNGIDLKQSSSLLGHIRDAGCNPDPFGICSRDLPGLKRWWKEASALSPNILAILQKKSSLILQHHKVWNQIESSSAQ